MAAAGHRLLRVSKQCKVFHRNFLISFCNNWSRHAAETKEENHIYKQPMNNRDVIDYLVKNVVFENENWIVTNKPYGIGCEKPYNLVSNYKARTFSDVYLKDILPLMSKELNVNSLEILLVPERFTSGVMVLGKTLEGVEKFKEYHLAEIKRGTLQYGFIGITLFEPVPKNGEKKFKLKYTKERKTNEIISSKKSFTGAVIICKHKLLNSSKFCSLVRIDANKLIYNCVSEYLEKICLSPILGEASFNLSVSKIGNVSFPVVANGFIKDSKNLDPELLVLLKLHENEISLIPKHLHLKSLTLKIGKNEELFVSVPPPDFFLWTCNQLNLSVNKNVFF